MPLTFKGGFYFSVRLSRHVTENAFLSTSRYRDDMARRFPTSCNLPFFLTTCLFYAPHFQIWLSFRQGSFSTRLMFVHDFYFLKVPFPGALFSSMAFIITRFLFYALYFQERFISKGGLSLPLFSNWFTQKIAAGAKKLSLEGWASVIRDGWGLEEREDEWRNS